MGTNIGWGRMAWEPGLPNLSCNRVTIYPLNSNTRENVFTRYTPHIKHHAIAVPLHHNVCFFVVLFQIVI